MRVRDLPKSRLILAAAIVIAMIGVPIYLIAHTDDAYDELSITDVDKVQANGSLRLVIKNDGGTTVRITDILPNDRPAAAGVVRVADGNGDDQKDIVANRDFVMGPLSKHVIILTRPAACLKELGLEFDIASGSQEHAIELDDPVSFGDASACS